MSINELLTENQNITISLTGEQLNIFANIILVGAREIYETKQQPETYLTRKEAAGKLDCTLSTLWRWNNENYLKPVEVGAKRRYRLSDVERILKGETSHE